MADNIYNYFGKCSICEQETEFTATDNNYRGSLTCRSCADRTIPRERALIRVLKSEYPNWRDLCIHESSPNKFGGSGYIRNNCTNYTPTYYFSNVQHGEYHNGFRNEDLEKQTFDDEVFDIVITQDVMEHINRPSLAFREIARTLKTNGAYIFTAPTYPGLVKSERRAYLFDDGSEEHIYPPEYHGNPISKKGSLVTFHYGYDLPVNIYHWSGLHTEVRRWFDQYYGIIGNHTEVYICRKY